MLGENVFNKGRLAQYEIYKECFTVKICMKDGKYLRKNFMTDITLAQKGKIRIGIDQSSSQTGIAVKKSNGEFLCLLDFVNESHLNYGLYKAMLGLKIEQIFGNCDVEICVIEKMWGGNKKSYEMLSNLGDFLIGFKYILPGWRDAEVASILPNVWRSAYLADSRYKGMFTKDKVKIAARNEGIRRYPYLTEYSHTLEGLGHINDSFDALGILEGYEAKTFSSDGSIRKVANTISATNHNYKYLVWVESSRYDLTDFMDEYSPRRQHIEYEYNCDFPFYENVRKVTSVTNKIVYMRITEDAVKIQLMWNQSKLYRRSDKMYLIGWRENVSSKLGNF